MATDTCSTPPLADRITKSLLGYGMIAGPIYVIVVGVQAATRAGFDPTRHPASMLANGHLGWIQTANFLVTGAMTIAAAVGMRRAMGPGRAASPVPVLVAGYGLGLLCAGVFRADPAPDFPPGSQVAAGHVSWHGALHLGCATIGFGCLIAACLVSARWFARQRRGGWAWFCGLTGLLFALGFGALAAGSQGVAAMLAFTAAVVLGWAWLAAFSGYLYRRADATSAV
jgi:hypothetical protein